MRLSDIWYLKVIRNFWCSASSAVCVQFDARAFEGLVYGAEFGFVGLPLQRAPQRKLFRLRWSQLLSAGSRSHSRRPGRSRSSARGHSLLPESLKLRQSRERVGPVSPRSLADATSLSALKRRCRLSSRALLPHAPHSKHWRNMQKAVGGTFSWPFSAVTAALAYASAPSSPRVG